MGLILLDSCLNKDEIENMEAMVTVICCTYNHEKYIRETLDGFLMQKTDFPVEYIVRDDASTDRTALIMREYEKKHPGFFNMVYEKENQYAKHLVPSYVARTIIASNSKYIALCEGDDYWCVPDKLQSQIKIMEQDPTITICTHSHYLLNDKTNKKKIVRPYKKTGYISTEESLLEPHGMPATCSMVMRTDDIKTYPYDKLNCPVGDRNRRMYLADRGKAFYLDKPMSVYRVNNSNSFGGKLRDYNASINLVEKMEDFYDRFNAYSNNKYIDIIPLLKQREYIAHYNRFGEYKKIVKTDYFKKFYSFSDKAKIYAKWRLSRLYTLYRKLNKLGK